jgi:small-conductance mechanosensitive channel
MVPSPSQAQDPIQLLDIDTYERSLAPGHGTTFNWTIRNIDVVPYDIQIEVTQATGWTVTVDPTGIQGLLPNTAAGVQLFVQAPDRVERAVRLDLQVRFTVTQDGAVIFAASRTATVEIPSIFVEKRVLELFSNPLPPPLDNEWGVFLLDVLIWLIISVAVLLVIIPFLKKVGTRTKTGIDDIIIRIIRAPLVVLLFLYGAIQSLSALDRHIDPGIQANLFIIYNVALTIILVYVAYKMFKDVMIYFAKTIASKTSSHIDDVLVPLVEKVGLAVIGLAGVALLLNYFSIDLTLFVAGGVVTSLVIAFAAQDTLSNFFSGIFLLTSRPFKEGDIIILPDGDWVEVRNVGMRTTRLFRFSDASIVTIPNNQMVNEKIANFSNPDDKGRVMRTFGVAYGSDPVQVKRILMKVMEGHPNIIKEEPFKPIVRFDAMADSSLNFFVLVWIDDRANRFAVQDYLNTEVYNEFNKAGIEIPFPQRTVHLRLEEGLKEGKGPPLELGDLGRTPGGARARKELGRGSGDGEVRD